MAARNFRPAAATSASERSLDVGVVTTINPLSPLILYAGAGPTTDSFTTYQSAIWDTANNPRVLTSSVSFPATTAPGSPFYIATQQLFIDAALRNISVFSRQRRPGVGRQVRQRLPPTYPRALSA
jgi:subtilase family serine protease